jgi:hypothetical protein
MLECAVLELLGKRATKTDVARLMEEMHLRLGEADTDIAQHSSPLCRQLIWSIRHLQTWSPIKVLSDRLHLLAF